MASRPSRKPTSGDTSRAEQHGSGCGAGKSCPSAPCSEGALLLGVMTSSGKLAYIQPPTRVDAEFVARANARGQRPEQAFRFSSPCVEGACPQWTGEGCGLGEMIVEHLDDIPATDSAGLPNCAIRGSCRWYSEQGRDACTMCPLIVADMGGTETYRSMHASSDADAEREAP